MAMNCGAPIAAPKPEQETWPLATNAPGVKALGWAFRYFDRRHWRVHAHGELCRQGDHCDAQCTGFGAQREVGIMNAAASNRRSRRPARQPNRPWSGERDRHRWVISTISTAEYWIANYRPAPHADIGNGNTRRPCPARDLAPDALKRGYDRYRVHACRAWDEPSLGRHDRSARSNHPACMATPWWPPGNADTPRSIIFAMCAESLTR